MNAAEKTSELVNIPNMPLVALQANFQESPGKYKTKLLQSNTVVQLLLISSPVISRLDWDSVKTTSGNVPILG